MVLAAVAALVCLLAAGCNEIKPTGGVYALQVEMVSADRYVVAGRSADRGTLLRALKSAGVGGDTRIEIAVGEGTAASEMSSLARDLAAVGLRRILFTRPRQVTVTTEPGP
jgi:hypothetical protein